MSLKLKQRGYSFSPGKVIISGEHSVVYGYPAIVAATELGVYCKVVSNKLNDRTYKKNNLELKKYEKYILSVFSKHYNKDISGLSIDSKIEIPIKSGMGSSAAYAHSALLALLTYFKLTVTKEETYLFVFECEKYIHGTPSGIDPFSVVYGGVYSFQKELKTGEIIKEKLELPKEYIFLLIDSGQASESTGEMVKKVSDDYKRNKKTQVILKDIGLISQKIKKELQLGTFSGELLDENQKLLEEIGVVGITAKQKVSLLRKNVAHVKITGAGGIKTGSGLLLVYVENLEKLDEIKTICKMNTWEYLETKVK